MSPEQMQPELGVDARADLYALGTIAYLMLGGKTPFTGDMMQLVMQKIMHQAAAAFVAPHRHPSGRRTRDHAVARDRARTIALLRLPSGSPTSKPPPKDIEDTARIGRALVVLAPMSAEVYVDDERKGSIGSSGRVVLTDMPAGQHILRVSKPANEMTNASSRSVRVRPSK